MKRELLSRLDCSLAVEIQLSLGVENTLYLHIVGNLIRNDLSCPLSVFLSVVQVQWECVSEHISDRRYCHWSVLDRWVSGNFLVR